MTRPVRYILTTDSGEVVSRHERLAVARSAQRHSTRSLVLWGLRDGDRVPALGETWFGRHNDEIPPSEQAAA